MTQILFLILFALIIGGLYWYICELKPAASTVENVGAFTVVIMLCTAIAVCFFGTIGGFNP